VTPRPGLVLGFAGAALLAGACASSAKPRQTPAEARLHESAPEKTAAQRSSARGLELEQNDERFGIEAAQAKRHEEAQKKEAAPPPPPPAPGPVDVSKQQKPPPKPPAP
jgi:hypothetical protein